MPTFIKDDNKTDKIMRNVLISLIPIIIFAVYKNGYIPYKNNLITFIEIFKVLLPIIVGSLTSFVIELIYSLKAKKNIKKTYSFFPGLFLSLILPFNIPLYVVFIGSMVASLSKIVYGGFGKNIFNPALIGYIFLITVYPNFFSSEYYFSSYELDTISTSTPLTNQVMTSNLSYDKIIKPYGTLTDFFIGNIPGAVAEVSSLLIIAAFIYLALTKTIKWRITLTYLLTVFVITLGMSRMLGLQIYYPLFHLLSGGLMFGAVFMATDPVTSTVTPIGQIIHGLVLGVLTVTLRTTATEGVAISILICNMLVFIFDKVGAKSRFSIRKSLTFLTAILIMISMSIIILSAIKRDNFKTDNNFNIISKETINNITVYNVSQKGYGGSIKASVKIENDNIIDIEILSNHETKDRYQLVMNEDYINKLIQNQNNLDNLDTISGATVTSTALKKLVINVMEDYK